MITPPIPHHRIICYFSCQQLIPLIEIFHFQKPGSPDIETPSGCKGKDLNYYWHGAVKNLDKELELYYLLQEVKNMRREAVANDAPGGNNALIIID